MNDNIDAFVQKEEKDRYETLKKCLFCGTDHIAGGGEMQCYGYIIRLIDDRLISLEGLLRQIGSHIDFNYTRKNYDR